MSEQIEIDKRYEQQKRLARWEAKIESVTNEVYQVLAEAGLSTYDAECVLRKITERVNKIKMSTALPNITIHSDRSDLRESASIATIPTRH
jgi:hypothetical protein